MTYVKKMVIQGFKSFAKRTEVIFDPGINTVVGPNGSGKSNVSDALCFALGRLSAKSIRAERTTNLLFSGTKLVKPAREAFVEVTFDNSQKTFNLPTDEVTISRIIRSNGQGIYKINNEIKNRGDIIELLAHAGIDPHGFNLVLQGQIQSIVKMHPEERRKVIEEVSGISVYEARKEKSLHELEKTEERLKEIGAVLRERKSFLNNLEKERSQALKYKDLEETINRCRYSILVKKILEVQKEIDSAKKSLEEKKNQREKIKTNLSEIQTEIDSMTAKINEMNSMIKKSSGVERETLQERINVLRGEIEGLKVRIEATQKRKIEFEKRIEHLKASVPEYRREIEELSKESPMLAKKQEEIKRKKAELVALEDQKNKLLSVKTELYSIKERLKEKESRNHKLEVESDSLLKQIENISREFQFKTEEECQNKIFNLEKESDSARLEVEIFAKKEIEHNRALAASESQIRTAEKIKEQILKIDICPLCQNQMTAQHIEHVTRDSLNKIEEGKLAIEKETYNIKELRQKRENLNKKAFELNQLISKLKHEYSNHKIANEKQRYLKSILVETDVIKKEISNLSAKKEGLENKSIDVTSITEQYNSKLREIEEISSRTTENLDQTLKFKEHELENILENIKNSEKGLEELHEEIVNMKERLEEKSSFLSSKEAEESELNKKFKKLFEDRDKIQSQIQENNYDISERRTEISQITDQINYIEIGIAKLSASQESIQIELKDVPESEPIRASIEVLQQKLEKAKQDMHEIGAINMRALEVYEQIKIEYDKVNEKVETLQKEKEEILRIIVEIDQKKKKTFMKTYKGINELFTRNASELYSKGKAFMKLENEEDIFQGGVDIVIQLGKGKYFDSGSLSGGEQTLIALSMLFAIQEFKPYHFYVFDEIDAALDKRNSERLAGLINKYIRAGQYIIVTHNDALIMNSQFIYGVSMHDGISKVLSLKLDKEIQKSVQNELNNQSQDQNYQQNSENSINPQSPNEVQ
ncbi:chromosome segregation protein SMC [Candidatus Pacearchaeota archaeon]|nr:chromosome segregation protein SMC [Candidatus Pacearchaeota archaeon]